MLSILPFFIYSRLRIPILPFLIIFSGYGINWMLDTRYKIQEARDKRKKISVFVFSLLLLITLFIGINRIIIPYRDNFDYSYYNYGSAFANSGEYKKAIECFNESLKISPYYKDALNGRVMAYNGLGRTYIQKGDWNNALDSFIKSTMYDSTYSPAFHNIGIVYKNLGKNDLAINNFERAVLLKEKTSDPVSVRIQVSLSELALLYEEKKEYSKAYNCWKKILEYSPNDEVEKAKKHILDIDSKIENRE
jgi:tetratricopeptide (TPR) repeat protein